MTGLFELAGRPEYVGANVTRREDDVLLTGRGIYVADIHLPEMSELTVIRSPVAHARIKEIRTDAARSAPGVIAVITASDLTDVSPYPNFVLFAKTPNTFPLAQDRVRYVGAPVAVVVAEDRYVGEDAAELVEVDYETLPPVPSMESALSENPTLLYDEWGDNKILDFPANNPEVRRILAESRVVRRTYKMGRHTAMPIETRAALAQFDDGRLTLRTSNQHPHIARTILSHLLPLEESNIRVVAPLVGGGFGQKQHVYPEEILVSWLAMRLGRPVRFVEDRSEHMVASSHARDQIINIEGAVDDQGRILAIRAQIMHDNGSCDLWPSGTCPAVCTGGHMTGPYLIPHAEVSVTSVATNKTPAGSYRGYGIPEAVFALERFVDDVAIEVGVDCVELRRTMLLDQGDLPYLTPSGALLDSGSYKEAFERVVELATVAKAKAVAQFGHDERARVGVGYATYREGTAPTHFGTSGHWTGQETCSITIDPGGGVLVSSGVTDQGQGASTFVATLSADALGVPIDQVRVVLGDTDACPYGLGAWGSRQAVVGGGAILKAAREVREKMTRIAAHMLEAPHEDMIIEHGNIHVKGSAEPNVTIKQVATVANIRTLELPEGMEPGLHALASYEPSTLEHVPDELGRINAAAAWVNATHAAVVRVDLDTGNIDILDYIVVHDCGRVINPPIVDGQIRGGVAQGIAGTLYEDLPYDDEGQLITSFMDYLIPSAAEMPDLHIEHMESPSPNLPLGIKGVGEGGTVGPAAAIGNAVVDALTEFNATVSETPITPELVLGMISDTPAT
jgi:carbon-monoxide dehydrogenase large subunit